MSYVRYIILLVRVYSYEVKQIFFVLNLLKNIYHIELYVI
jgi:hypothetical protein